jgi:hypothetical protein
MRLAALLLLLANVVYLAWVRYAPASGSVEPQLIAQQIHPEAIRLLSQQQVAVLAARNSEAHKTLACLEWGAFNAADVARAQAALEPIAPGGNVSQREVEEAAGWWVYLPPQSSRQSAIQKVAELNRLGIDDYFIVQEDARLRFAISLGVYRTEEAARARLDLVREKGARTAVMATRQTPVHKVYLQMRELPEGLQSKIIELRDAFPGTDLKACAA